MIAQIRQNLRGAMRLFVWDADGFHDFDVSFEGFWRSFWALGIALPFYVIAFLHGYAAILQRDTPSLQAPQASYFFLETTGFILAWLIVPVLLIAYASVTKTKSRYVPLIVSHNWAQLLILLIASVILALGALALIPLDLFYALIFVLQIVSLSYKWNVSRIALEGQSLTAIGVVLIDLVASLAIAQAVYGLHGWPPSPATGQ